MQRRTLLSVLFAAMLTVAGLPATAGSASADVVDKGTLFSSPGYDYGASVIQTGSVRQYWWCSIGLSTDGVTTDQIKYRSYNSSTNTWSAVQTVLRPTTNLPTWDRSYICDPSVIKGSFSYAGLTYSYAMYYTATDRGPGTSYAGTAQDGTNNRIGVAYSNDGVTWVRYANNPVIYPQSYPTDNYGAGQASSYNYNGGSGLKLFFHDDSVISGPWVWERDTTNGTTFGARTAVSGAGVNPDGSAGPGFNPDIAFSPTEQKWYAIWPLSPRSRQNPLLPTPDRETYRAVLATMPASTFPSGTWTRLTDVDTNLTGQYLNENPALVRDVYGNVTPTLPSVEVVMSEGGNDPGSWDLHSVVYSPPTGARPLNRYFNGSAHLVTTGFVPAGYAKEMTLGYLAWAPTSGTVPLYACVTSGLKYFPSLDALCEGTTNVEWGNNGYIWTSPPAPTGYVQVYRCLVGSDYFVSTSASCEGQTVDRSLGWVRTTA